MNRMTVVAAALGVSLVVNVFAIAFVAGQWSQHEVRLDMADLWPASEAIRQKFRAELASNRADILAALGEIQRGRRVVQAATRGSFDRAAVETALADMRASMQQLQTIGHNALLAALEEESRSEVTVPD